MCRHCGMITPTGPCARLPATLVLEKLTVADLTNDRRALPVVPARAAVRDG